MAPNDFLNLAIAANVIACGLNLWFAWRAIRKEKALKILTGKCRDCQDRWEAAWDFAETVRAGYRQNPRGDQIRFGLVIYEQKLKRLDK